MEQVHGTDVADADPHREPRADALIVGPGQVGAVMVADCAPVLIAGTTGEVTMGAAVHAGRPGLLGNIASAAVAELVRRGLAPADLTAVIGPTICGACYEVPEELAAKAEEICPPARCITRWGTPGIDIRSGLVHQLTSLGVRVRHVRACTAEDDRFFSHRGSGGRTGRCAGVIAIPRHSDEVRAPNNTSAIP